MVKVMLCFIAVYLVFFLYGFWLYVLFIPKERTNLRGLLTLAPIFGICVISLYFTNAVGLSVHFSAAKTPFEILTLLLTLITLWRRWPVVAHKTTQFSKKIYESPGKYLVRGCLLLGMILGLMAPILDKPITTPWRIGPDAAGYTASAKFLLEDKTLSGISGKFTSPSEIYAYEFLVQGMRRGFVSIMALVADLFHLHPAQVAFATTAVCLFLCLLVVILLTQLLLRDSHRLFPYLIALAIAFNCNLLFILYEGGYAQIASLPLIMTFILWQYAGIPVRQSFLWKVLLGGVLVAAATEIYLESMLIIPMMLIGYWFVDGLTQKRFTFGRREVLVAIGAVILSFGLNWNVMSHWFRFERNASAVLNLAGWAQPQWAYFPEIMGWVNIYRHVVGNIPWYINHLSPLVNIGSLGITSLFGGFLLLCLLNRQRVTGVAAVPALMILGAYWYFKWHRQVNNYSYMKIYTLVLPALAIGYLGSLLTVKRYRQAASWVMGSLVILTVFNGLSFIRTYRSNSAFLSSGLLELKDAEKTVDLSGYVLLSVPETDEHNWIRDIFVRSLFSSKFIHPGFFPQQDFSDYRHYPVALLVHHPRKDVAYDPSDILWQGSEYLILNTHIPVEEAWKDKSRIPWAPQPAHVAPPGIEVVWTIENTKRNAALDYDFSKYYEKVTSQEAKKAI